MTSQSPDDRTCTLAAHTGHPRRILVTGGLGFIGVHLCESLLQHFPDAELTIVDNLSSTRVDYRSLVPRATIYIQDLRDFTPTAPDFDDIFHLASPVGSLGILERHGHIASDILELAHVASDLAASSHADLLYLSSSEVYGRDGEHDESAEQRVPDRRGSRMEYALGKLTAEHVLYNLADAGTHRVRIVRPFNVTGRWQSEALGFVIPRFFRSALDGSPLQVHGSGRQTRSFCDVTDLAEGVLAVQYQAPAGLTYNIGNPDNRIDIATLAHRIHALCDSSSTVAFIDPEQVYGAQYLEAYNKMPVIERAVSLTSWRPRKSLDDILADLHRFHRTNLFIETCA